MKTAILATILLAASPAYAQFAKDVTPPSQQQQNLLNDLKALERARQANGDRAAAEQRARQLWQSLQEAQAAEQRARIQANADVEAAKQRQPDVCVGYCPQWGQR
jgi:Tfp pilus assembly protein PilE